MAGKSSIWRVCVLGWNEIWVREDSAFLSEANEYEISNSRLDNYSKF